MRLRAVLSEYGISQVWGGAGILDRVLNRFPTFTRDTLLALRNPFRKRGRLILSLITLTFAGAVFMAIVNLRSSLYASLGEMFSFWRYDSWVILDGYVSADRLVNEAKTVPGVEGTEVWNFALARYIRPDGSESSNLYLIAPPAGSHFLDPPIIEGRHFGATARSPTLFALRVHLLQAAQEQADAVADQPPVGLELRLAGPAQADTALLALQVGPATHQARRDVAQLGEFDLEPADVRARPLREYVEDEAGAVENATAERPLEIALLRGAERVIEDDERRVVRLHGCGDLGHLAAADEVARIGRSRWPNTKSTGSPPADSTSSSSSRGSSCALPDPSSR